MISFFFFSSRSVHFFTSSSVMASTTLEFRRMSSSDAESVAALSLSSPSRRTLLRGLVGEERM